MLFYNLTMSILRGNNANQNGAFLDDVYCEGFADGGLNVYTDGFADGGANRYKDGYSG